MIAATGQANLARQHSADGADDYARLAMSDGSRARLWVSRLALTDFRSYASAVIEAGPEPVVLLGANGAGKTNLLEAISLLAPGSGLRRASYDELARLGGAGGWAVAAHIDTSDGPVEIGTGQRGGGGRNGDETRGSGSGSGYGGDGGRQGRIVRINGDSASPGALADLVNVVWLTPSMDGLFTGPAADRRQFLDRLVLCFDPSHSTRSNRFERAMRQRNRLLEDERPNPALLDALEVQLAETGVAIAAARLEAVSALAATADSRRSRDPTSPFPWFEIALDGSLEMELARQPAIDVEDAYRARLAASRSRDRAACRLLEGPHRSDLVVGHGPKAMPARLSSTGEQKALLTGLVLAHAGLIAERRGAGAPLLLLDEVAAHFDEVRRTALYREILMLGTQAWLTGTERSAFAGLKGQARFLRIEDGLARPD